MGWEGGEEKPDAGMEEANRMEARCAARRRIDSAKAAEAQLEPEQEQQNRKSKSTQGRPRHTHRQRRQTELRQTETHTGGITPKPPPRQQAPRQHRGTNNLKSSFPVSQPAQPHRPRDPVRAASSMPSLSVLIECVLPSAPSSHCLH